MKQSYPEAYITQDYARAIKEERKILVKAMTIGRNQDMNIKVLDRNLIIGNRKYNVNNLPENLRD